jgi:mono/diheme cytochrome c family protein
MKVVMVRFSLLAAIALLSVPGLRAQEVDRGLTLFTEAGCASCHGAQGGGTALGPQLAASGESAAAFIVFVRQPVRTMPAYAQQVISDQDLERMYRSLQAQTATRVPTGRPDIGAQLYAADGCYSCHANEAQGGMHGPRLGPGPISFARFSWYVRQPTRTMPPYSPVVLSDQEIADIYAFVAAQPEPPALSSIPLLAP